MARITRIETSSFRSRIIGLSYEALDTDLTP